LADEGGNVTDGKSLFSVCALLSLVAFTRFSGLCKIVRKEERVQRGWTLGLGVRLRQRERMGVSRPKLAKHLLLLPHTAQ
jgi:hypothetical protein